MKIKVLEINGYAMLYRGAEVLLLNIYKEIDKAEIQMDFLTPLDCRNDQMRQEIESRGGKIYELNAIDRPILNKLVFFKLINFIKMHQYDIIHIHTGSIVYMALASLAARIAGAKVVIVHSHNSADVSTGVTSSGWKKKICSPIIQRCSTYKWACSDKASEYMFGTTQDTYIMNNGIYIDDFSYSKESRIRVRNALKIQENEIVIGHVAQFTKVKNHKFLIDIFEELSHKYSNVKLLLVGSGELFDDMQKYVNHKELSDKVFFYGISKNVAELLSSMDVFVLPSYFEGLPVVGIEAQCSGLPCYISNCVTKQLDLTGNVKFLPIDEGIEPWVSALSNAITNIHRDIYAPEKLKKRRFDICDVSNEVCKKYKSIIQGESNNE